MRNIELPSEEPESRLSQSRLSQSEALKTIKVRRRSRDVYETAMSLLGKGCIALESAFKAADVNGDGSLCHAEVEAAFKSSGALTFSEEALKPLLEDLLEQHGGRINYAQFKDVAWRATVNSAPLA